MPDRTIERRLQDAGDAALASDDGPIFSIVAKLVEALERSIPEGTENAERKKEALTWGLNCSAGPSTKKSDEHLRASRDLVAGLSTHNEVLTSSYHGFMSLLPEITQRGDGI